MRLLILAAAITGLSFIGWTQGSEAYQRITAKPSSTWFAPYDDVTLTPEYHFEDPVVSPSLTQMLGFVVSDPKNPCAPTWGTYYDMDGAGRALDLDRRIVRLRERGGDAVISFGGAANTDLAVACTSQKALNGAYSRVVKRYSSKIIDLDIEGAALSNTAANLRRAIAMRTLQSGSSSATRLRIWLDAAGRADRADGGGPGPRRADAQGARRARRRERDDDGLRRRAPCRAVDAHRHPPRAAGDQRPARDPVPERGRDADLASGVRAHGRDAR